MGSAATNDSRKAVAARRHSPAPGASRAAASGSNWAASERKVPRTAVLSQDVERSAVLDEKS
jgi:hypothetical protein